MGIVETINSIMGNVKGFTAGARTAISSVIGEPFLMIIMFTISLFLAYLIAKRSIIRPLSGHYIIQTLVITILIFLILMYL
jgi:hypothetical protein